MMTPRRGFNPRPARWLGETFELPADTSREDVSIHAQHGGWAKLEGRISGKPL